MERRVKLFYSYNWKICICIHLYLDIPGVKKKKKVFQIVYIYNLLAQERIWRNDLMLIFFHWTIFWDTLLQLHICKKKYFWPVLLQNYMEINCKTAVSNHLCPTFKFLQSKILRIKKSLKYSCKINVRANFCITYDGNF